MKRVVAPTRQRLLLIVMLRNHLQVLTTTARQETTSPAARDESQQQYSESAAFFTADEDENKDTQEDQDETSLTATTTRQPQISKENGPSKEENHASVPREVQVTFSSCIHEDEAEEQVRVSTLPTTSEEAVGESAAAASGADKETPMDMDGSLANKDETTAVPDATLADVAQTTRFRWSSCERNRANGKLVERGSSDNAYGHQRQG